MRDAVLPRAERELHESAGELGAWHTRTRAGDVVARERLIGLLYPYVYAVLRRRLIRYPSDVVIDALQEAIVCVSDQLPTCRARSGRQLVAWAGIVGWRAAIRFLRSPAAGLATGLNAVPLDMVTGRDRPHGWDRAADDPVWYDSGLGALYRDLLCQDPDVRVTEDEADHETATGDSLEHTAEEVNASATPRATLAQVVLSGWVELCARNASSAAILWLRAADGCSYRDIAAMHGTTPAAAKRRYQRALVALRVSVWRHAAALPGNLRPAVVARLRALDPDGPGRSPASPAS